jgi:uncharacterized protein YdgA (DUF945 family)
MKKIVVGVVVLLLVLVVAPWAIGRMAEKHVDAKLDQLVEAAPYLTIVERKWTGGWFTSEQEVTFEVFGAWMRALNPATVLREGGQDTAAENADAQLAEVLEAMDEAEAAAADSSATLPESPGAATDDASEAEQSPEEPKPVEPIRFTVRNRILHGPVLWPFSLGIARVDSQVVLSEEARQAITDFFGTDQPVQVRSRVGFFGGGSTRFSGDGRTVKLKNDAGAISYDDFRFDVCYSKKLDDIETEGRWPRVEFTDTAKGGSVMIEDVTFESESERLSGDLYDTDFDFSVKKATITNPAKSVTTADKIHYVADTEVKDGFLDMALRFGSGKIVNPELSAIELQLNEIHYDFTMRHLHIETLAKLIGAFKELYKTPLADPKQVETLFVEPFKEHGVALLTHDPELVLDRIGIVTPEGEGVIKGVLRLKGATAEDFTAAGPMGLIAKLDAEITIEVAQKLLEKLPNGATGAGLAVDQGFASREEDKLVSRITFKAGELKINGKVQPIPGLGGPPADEQGAPSEGMDGMGPGAQE